MTIAVDLGRKATKQTKKKQVIFFLKKSKGDIVITSVSSVCPFVHPSVRYAICSLTIGRNSTKEFAVSVTLMNGA